MKIHFVFGVSLMLEPYHVFIILKKIPKPPPFIEINDEQKYEAEEIFIIGYQTVNSNISSIGELMMLMNEHGN
jgi:hypothetical protein